MKLPAPPALMRVFQLLATQTGLRFGVLQVETHQAVGVEGTCFYCTYRLLPAQLPESDGWAESAEAPSIEQALELLDYSLRVHAQYCFFSES